MIVSPPNRQPRTGQPSRTVTALGRRRAFGAPNDSLPRARGSIHTCGGRVVRREEIPHIPKILRDDVTRYSSDSLTCPPERLNRGVEAARPQDFEKRKSHTSVGWFVVPYIPFLQKVQSAQIVLIPSRVGDHRFEGPNRKSIAQAVISYYDATTIRMAIDAMTSSSSLQREPILVQRLQEPSGRGAARNIAHRLTTTEGEGHSTAPFSGSEGIGSPAAIRSST